MIDPRDFEALVLTKEAIERLFAKLGGRPGSKSEYFSQVNSTGTTHVAVGCENSSEDGSFVEIVFLSTDLDDESRRERGFMGALALMLRRYQAGTRYTLVLDSEFEGPFLAVLAQIGRATTSSVAYDDRFAVDVTTNGDTAEVVLWVTPEHFTSPTVRLIKEIARRLHAE